MVVASALEEYIRTVLAECVGLQRTRSVLFNAVLKAQLVPKLLANLVSALA